MISRSAVSVAAGRISTVRIAAVLAAALAVGACSSATESTTATVSSTASSAITSSATSASAPTATSDANLEPSDSANVSRDSVVSAVTADVIVPAYAQLAASLNELQRSLEGLCASPDDASKLDAAQLSWRAASADWSRTRAFRFGPAMDLRAMSKIKFPVDVDKIDKLIKSDAPVDSASVAALGADQRGLSGIELVLFGDEAISTRRCQYAVSAAGPGAAAADAVVEQWRTDPPTDTKQFIDDVINGVVFALTDVGDSQLGLASGDVSGTPQFAELDSGPARQSLADMAAMLDSVDLVMASDALSALVAAQSADTMTRVRAELDSARSALDDIAEPLFSTTDVGALSNAYKAVRIPLTTVRAEVASLLAVTLTLGDADGDS
jgi:predicted lipoprotein